MPPTTVDPLGQPADTTAQHQAVPAGPSARHAARELATATALDAGRGLRGWLRSWRRDPAGHAMTLVVGCIVAVLMTRAHGWQMPTLPGQAPEVASAASLPQDAAVAATAAAEHAALAATPGDVSDLPAAVTRWWPQIVAAVQAHPATGLTPRLVACMMQQESSGNPKAVSPKGASGLMQIYPVAHPDYDVARGFDDTAYNIDYGVAYMAELLGIYGTVAEALHHYNGNGRYNGYNAAILPCAGLDGAS